MTPLVLLLRGINVGGHNRLAMADFRTALAEAGIDAARTYIQSGNAVGLGPDPTPELEATIAAAIERIAGIAPPVLALTGEAFCQILADDPYPEPPADDRFRHMLICRSAPSPDLFAPCEAARGPDSLAIAGRAVYLDTPNGIARSKFAECVTRALGNQTTARNLRSMARIAAMVAELPASHTP